MPDSPLSVLHASASATLLDITGWQIPDYYGSVTEEYESVRHSVGIADQSHRGKLRVAGKDRQAFLHRMVTNDIQSLAPGHGVYACLLTPQGKILTDMTVYLREQDILIDLEPGMAAVLKTALDRYALMDDVTIEDVTQQYGLLGVYGLRSVELLQKVFGPFPTLADGHHHRAEFMGASVLMMRVRRTGMADYEVYCPSDRAPGLWKAFLEQDEAWGVRPVGHQALERLRVEAGIPRYGAELDDRIIPNEAIKERAVSFTKGCYVGQEPVVMMEHRGRPNRLLAGLSIRGTAVPEHNAVLKKDDQDAGWITTAVHGDGGVIALGFVRRKFLITGEHLTVDTTDGVAEATLIELPFYRQSSSSPTGRRPV